MSDISQGSVATHMRYGGIFGDSVTANFILIPTVKKLESRLIFPKVIGIKVHCAILAHPVHVVDIIRWDCVRATGLVQSGPGVCVGRVLCAVRRARLQASSVLPP